MQSYGAAVPFDLLGLGYTRRMVLDSTLEVYLERTACNDTLLVKMSAALVEHSRWLPPLALIKEEMSHHYSYISEMSTPRFGEVSNIGQASSLARI
jgi:hypothetical protein